jgi:hypothetical protein
MARNAAGASTTFIGSGTYPFMHALRLVLVKEGQTFSGYVCPPAGEGRCTLIGTTTASISPDGYIGLAVTSHDPTLVATAVFGLPRPITDGWFPF